MSRKNQEALNKLEKHIGEPVTFGLYLKAIREGEELTQSELADKLGVSVQHVSNVENGHKGVSIQRAAAWAKTLGYPEAVFVQLALRDEFERAGLQGYQVTVSKAS